MVTPRAPSCACALHRALFGEQTISTADITNSEHDAHCEVTGDRVLISTVASGDDIRRRVLVEVVVHQIQKAEEMVVEDIARGHEGDRNACRDTNCVIDIE